MACPMLSCIFCGIMRYTIIILYLTISQRNYDISGEATFIRIEEYCQSTGNRLVLFYSGIENAIKIQHKESMS